ncbi:TonB-dependent receptor [Sphingomonas rhizophila]|uniref:TonB-dependent receptor n=1 Tax=Sphingomonas rhizophila TaxID=2071607 RepID=A0A7G9SCU4_9SPHN|nr:TonB-dependent receptor [Sphingomonas rhizophila]QNN65669.1 TonB-dependent receptor [Sphingomonas rhizophila]
MLWSAVEGNGVLGETAMAALAAAGLQPTSTAKVDLDAPDTVIVTGERTTRTLRRTSSSVEVYDERQIERNSGADRIEQLLDLTPNVQVGSGGEGPTIRGQDTTGPTRDLPAFLGGTRPRTTLIVDGRAISFNEFVFGAAPLWDVQRVEVFRSPQTTTQGQNSIAGAIFVETGAPTFVPEFRMRAIAGDYRTRQVSLMGSGPLSDDVAIRIAGDMRSSRPSSLLADRAVGADPNRDLYGTLRTKLLFRPSGSAGPKLELGYAHIESQMPQIEGVRPPFEERRDPVATYGTFRVNVDSLTARSEIRLSPVLLLRTTLTGGETKVRRFAPAGLGQNFIRGRDRSAETVFDWTPSDGFKVIVGASVRQAKLRQRIDLSQLSGIGRFRDRQSAVGIFGEGTWALAPGLEVTAGLRFQRDSQERVGALESSGGPIDLAYDQRFRAWLPKASIAWDVTKSVRVGAVVQRAYNPGGTTLRFDTGEADNFGEERLTAYEIFARYSFANGRLTANANLFRYEMDDPQRSRSITIFAPTGAPVGFADLFNLQHARSHGGEATLNWQPSTRFSMRAGVGLLRTQITEADGEYASFKGKQFQRSPKFSASLAIDWMPLRGLNLSAQARRNSGYFSDDLNAADRHVAGWTNVDARVAYDLRKLRLFGYVRNVFDSFHLTYLLNSSLATAGDPREFGMGIEYRY